MNDSDAKQGAIDALTAKLVSGLSLVEVER